jgi:hypothetical protein
MMEKRKHSVSCSGLWSVVTSINPVINPNPVYRLRTPAHTWQYCCIISCFVRKFYLSEAYDLLDCDVWPSKKSAELGGKLLRPTWRHNPEDRTLHSHRCDNFRSISYLFVSPANAERGNTFWATYPNILVYEQGKRSSAASCLNGKRLSVARCSRRTRNNRH